MTAEDERCRMRGCTREAEHTLTFRRHDEIDVCEKHRRRNVAIKYGVLLGVSAVVAGLVLALYWIVV